MLIDTAMLGQIDVDEGDIFHLPEGLYGFESESDYALITKQDEDFTLMWFQAVKAPAPCFVVFDPCDVVDDYTPKLDSSDLASLGATGEDQLSFLVIAVVPEDVSQISVNLKSPIALSRQNKTAKQVLLQNQDYPIKYYLFGQDGAAPECVPEGTC